MHTNGVIRKSDGVLLRAGYGIDWVNDGAFDSDTEELIDEIPHPVKVEGQPGETNKQKYVDDVWEEVAQ